METTKKGKFRNLEIISSNGSSSQSGSKELESERSSSGMDRNSTRERRHLPRLSLSSEQFKHSETGKIFSVTDLSKKGMGLWLFEPEDLNLFWVGGHFEGTLNLKREKYQIQARVRNLNSDRIGCEFEKLSQSCADSIANFLNPATLGAELKLIPSVELDTLWYHGPSGTDLLIRRTADGQYHRITLYILGSFIQWDESEGLSTGRTAPTESHSEIRGIHRLETLYLDPDPTLDSEKLEIAKTVVLSSNLPLELKEKWKIFSQKN
ncbi:MAG: hypothetical protein ABIQ95_08710 [Bdellovibrionia bacterium]